MKSAGRRDKLATREKVIGFEMQGAGAWDTFPTVIIEGVCDYADSHKNKKWQKYETMKRLVFSRTCSSWFKNGKIHGFVVARYASSRLHYRETMRESRYEDFDTTYFTGNRFQFWGNGYTRLELEGKVNLTWYLDDPNV